MLIHPASLCATGTSGSSNPPRALARGCQRRTDTRARPTGLWAGTAPPPSAEERVWVRVRLEGTGHCWHSRAPQSWVSPLATPGSEPVPTFTGLGPCATAGSRCWPWGSLCDRAGDRAGQSEEPGREHRRAHTEPALLPQRLCHPRLQGK